MGSLVSSSLIINLYFIVLRDRTVLDMQLLITCLAADVALLVICHVQK